MSIYYETDFTPEVLYKIWVEHQYIDLEGLTDVYKALLDEVYNFAMEMVLSWPDEYRAEIRKKAGYKG